MNTKEEEIIKKIDRLENKNYDLKSKNSTLITGLMFLGLVILFLIFFIIVGFSKISSIQTLDLEDVLMKYHVLKYYPEFEKCEIRYNNCIAESFVFCKKGAEIYCNQSKELIPRDGLIPVSNLEEQVPDEVLILKGVKLKDIYRDWKEEGFK